jgi:hypothetical protein
MQLDKRNFPDSATFIEKKRVKNRLWQKVHFANCGEKVQKVQSAFMWRKKLVNFCGEKI